MNAPAVVSKACAVNPLKMSQPLGAALAFLGIDNAMPVFHGSQGCTAFGLVLFVRHFRESIPLQTTAMNEVTTILGGGENIEKALLNIHKRAKPSFIGIASTGLTETKGDDVMGDLRRITSAHPELDMPIVYVSTPDYKGAFQDGWAKAVTAIVESLASPLATIAGQVTILPGCHMTPGDITELCEIVADFGLKAIVLPDLSRSLDGHIPDDFTPTSLGGTTRPEIARIGASQATIAIGEQMRPAADALTAKTGVPAKIFDTLTGLAAADDFFSYLSTLSGRPVPEKYRRQRNQLVDAMLDAHFFFGGKRIAIGAEPDLLWALGAWLKDMGCTLTALVSTTESPVLARFAGEGACIGDLEDLEGQAHDCDLLITHSHGRQAAARLGIPFLRMGLPVFDRLGEAHRVIVGYRGTRNLVFEIGNIFLANDHEPQPDGEACAGVCHPHHSTSEA
ncbi:nitrogenase iron-molybdenum cofactor biosynthesis protein NifN [Acidiferrobacter sp.]|uniref:nitrogenase iron-molybdenum cofactor biosynthesis protein NifN n=1 Tax=Acidiferrobacter sp. TaxID=1872107 RepID=UPI00262F3238|nr:nitrogenase iron-molybdenum cofactor biosynthesis protein NifN [Acidiferrobacter sp.]